VFHWAFHPNSPSSTANRRLSGTQLWVAPDGAAGSSGIDDKLDRWQAGKSRRTGHISDETILPDDETISGLPRKKPETVAAYGPSP
jgi:hypothetical protein